MTGLPESVRIVDGVWTQILATPADRRPRPALFLDRDGVVVEEVGYLCRPGDVRLAADAARVIAAANAAGVLVVIVTNQSGIGRGLYGWADFAAVQEVILGGLAAAGAHVDAVYACPHHPEARGPFRHPDPPARKPNPGMLLAAAASLPIALRRSWIVGDRPGDLEAGRRAGLAGGLLLDGGDGDPRPDPAFDRTPPARPFAYRSGRSIADALTLPLFADPPTRDRSGRPRSRPAPGA